MFKRPSHLFSKLGLVFFIGGLFVLAYLDAMITQRFQSSVGQEPMQVYARSLELFEGKRIDREQLNFELAALSYQRVTRPDVPGQFAESGGRYTIFSRGFLFTDGEQQPGIVSFVVNDNAVGRLLDSKSREVMQWRLEPLRIGSVQAGSYEDREVISLHQVPPTFLELLIATEDRGFGEHWGISLRGLARAMWANVKAGAWVQGGSTLTQQVIKNTFFTTERSFLRKLAEIPLAVLLEWHFSKEEILESYINEVFLGQDGSRAIHGFNLAARYYFGRSLDHCSLAQQALLVGLVKGASYYNPRRHPRRALERRNLVLQQAHKYGYVSADELQAALDEPLILAANEQVAGRAYPAFMDYVRRQLRSSGAELADLIQAGDGVRIFTTLDPWLQQLAEQQVARGLVSIEGARNIASGRLQGALVAVQPATGAVQAMVGDRNARFAGFNRALDTQRPVGSLLKPAVYLAALRGGDFNLASIVSDGPVSVQDKRGVVWEPQNYDKRSHGDVLLEDALVESYNQATVRLGMLVGMDAVMQTLRDLGIKADLPALPSVMLGAAPLAPVEIAAMYANIASDGRTLRIRGLDSVDIRGEIRRFVSAGESRIAPQQVFLLRHALHQVVERGTARSARRELPGWLEVAGKTGTSDDGRDSWFAGFSGDLVAVVWVGADDNAPLELTGSAGALKVWSPFVAAASYRAVSLAVPPGVQMEWIDAEGRLAEPACGNVRAFPFVNEYLPKAVAPCRRAPVEVADPVSRERKTLWRWIEGVLNGL